MAESHAERHLQIAARRAQAPDIRDLFEPGSSTCQWSNWGLREAMRTLFAGTDVVPGGWRSEVTLGSSSIPDGDPDPVHYYAHLANCVLPYAVNVGSPRCLAHMTAIAPEFVHELTHVLLALNQNLVKRDASGSFTTLERETLAMMHRLVFDLSPDFYHEHAANAGSNLGMFCSGGTLANLTALWIARNRKLGAVETIGLPAALEESGYIGAVIVGSTLMHYSLRKAAALLGLGEQQVRGIPVDERGRMQAASCRDVLKTCVEGNVAVLALIGVAGTTDYGSIDPLDGLADLAEEFGIHYHVDAAWGGTLLFSTAHRGRLAGIARAQSVTMDAHKQMYLPVGTSLLLLRDPHASRAIEKSSDYVLQDGTGDLGRHSIEGSRPGTSLFVHAALHIIGQRGYERLVDESLTRAAFMAQEVQRRRDFELLATPETNIVVYRYVPRHLNAQRSNGDRVTVAQDTINRFNTLLHQEQLQRSRTAVSRTLLRHPQYSEPIAALRAVMANPLVTESDVTMLLDDQASIAAGLLQGAE